MADLVLLRHGRSDWNGERGIQGQSDSQLDELAHPRHRGVRRRGVRLREYSLGPREGLLHHEFAAAAPEEFAEFARANWEAVPGAERRADVAARMTAAVGDAVADLPPDGVALVVSHGAAIRTGLAALVGWSSEEALTLRGMDN